MSHFCENRCNMNLLDFPDEILLEIFSHCGGSGGLSNAIVTCKKLYSLREDIFNIILKQCFPSDVPSDNNIALIKSIAFDTDSITHSREIYPNNNGIIHFSPHSVINNIISIDKKLNWIIYLPGYSYSIGDLPHICDGGFPINALQHCYGSISCHSKDKIKIVYKTYTPRLLHKVSNVEITIKIFKWILSRTTTTHDKNDLENIIK